MTPDHDDPTAHPWIRAEAPKKRLEDIVSDFIARAEEEANAVRWLLHVEFVAEAEWGLRIKFFLRAILSERRPGRPR